MSKAIQNLVEAQQQAMRIRPKVGGFPLLAEVLCEAGVTRNIWHLPSCQSLYMTKYGTVVNQGTPLINGTADIPQFDEEALIHVLRTDQAGKSTIPEFLQAAWKAGVTQYEVDFEARKVTYMGCLGEEYIETYPKVSLAPL